VAFGKYHVDSAAARHSGGRFSDRQEQAQSEKGGQGLRVRLLGVQRVQLAKTKVDLQNNYREERYEADRIKNGYAGEDTLCER
jgi:ATP phosphoribosyltransferase regulatory subunit HisZ